MERCALPYRARSSFEKALHIGKAHPRLQVIGFNVRGGAAAAVPINADHETKEGMQGIMSAAAAASTPAANAAAAASDHNNKTPKPASSPRSALQQLLLSTQSLPSTSPPSANHSLPPGSSSSSSSAAGLILPATSSPPPTNQTALLHQPAISPPAANQNLTSGVSKPPRHPPSPPSAYQSLKSLLQSEFASSDVSANQSSRTSFFTSLGQSQCASSPSSARGGSVSVNVQTINSKPSTRATIKDKYEAFFRIKQTDDEACSGEQKEFNNAKPHEIKGRLINSKEVINEPPHVGKSKNISWLHYDEHPSTESCKKSSCKGVQQSPFGNDKSRKSSWNEEKSKKSSLFMFAVSSPAPEFHNHHHHVENDMCKDMDFLSSCHLCGRFLGQGEDVFMYSGDKAFCSMECRYQQIVIDERNERCPPPIIRSGASQVYQHTTTTTHHPIMINKPHFMNTTAAA